MSQSGQLRWAKSRDSYRRIASESYVSGVSKGGGFVRGEDLNNWGGARTGCNN